MMQFLRGSSEARREIETYVTERIKELYAQLGAINCDPRRADTIRGRIAELQKLLSVVNNRGDSGNE